MALVGRVFLVAILACVLLLGSASPETDLEDEVLEQYDENEVENEVVGQYTDEDENDVASEYMDSNDEEIMRQILDHLKSKEASGQSFSINSQVDLNRLLRQILPYLRNQLLNLRVSDFSGSTRRVSYTISNVQITDVQFGSTSLSHNGIDTLRLSATLNVLSGRANWRYRYKWGWVRIRDSGSMNVNANSITMSIGIRFSGGSTPTLQATGCNFNIGHLSVRFRGGASWIYNLFRGRIARVAKDALNRPGLVCGKVEPIINNQGSRLLQRLSG